MRFRITLPHTSRLRRRPAAALLGGAIAIVVSFSCAAPALAVTNLEGWLQDDPILMSNPVSAFQQLRTLGVTRVRLTVRWNTLAPASTSKTMPHGFKGSNPASYAATNWAPYDAVVRAAAADGVKVNFDLAGPEPVWAAGKGHPSSGRGEVEWIPNDADYTAFVKAVATRYSGSYTPSGASSPLPRITFWTLWNEPNYGAGLTPQALPSDTKVFAAPTVYRHLVNDGWTALHQTGHGSDMIVIGEITPRGVPNPQQPTTHPGVFSYGILPIPFVQAMYCLGSNYKPVRGKLATEMKCPTNAAGTARFKSQNPALFGASGFSIHPYSRYFPPNVEKPNDKLYASFADLGNLTTVLDKSNEAYHSGKKFPIWNTEYGYITSPPKPHYDPIGKTYYASVTDAADYINFAEYLSYKNPRVMNYMQYLLVDPEQPAGASNDYGGYASGLEAFGGTKKLTYYAFQMPLYLPKTTSGSDEVWGDVRPARYAMMDEPGDSEAVTIEFTPSGSTTPQTLATIPITNAYGYYDTHVSIPGAGTVQAVWQFPTNDLSLLPGQFATSRPVTVS
jgi:hypothetical protein